MLLYCFLEEESIENIKSFYKYYWKRHNPRCWLKKIKQINNSFIKEIDQNKLLSNKNKNVVQL